MAALATVAAGAMDYIGGGRANDANKHEARKNRQFQERMSNTAYQRGMKDMKLAGLNPILSAKLGGASTPAGSLAAPMQNTAKGPSEALMKMSGVNLQNQQAELASQSARNTQYEADRNQIFNEVLNELDAPALAQMATQEIKELFNINPEHLSTTAKGAKSNGKKILEAAKGTFKNMGKGYGKTFTDYYKSKFNVIDSEMQNNYKKRKQRKKYK